jgi:hypothetical protein
MLPVIAARNLAQHLHASLADSRRRAVEQVAGFCSQMFRTWVLASKPASINRFQFKDLPAFLSVFYAPISRCLGGFGPGWTRCCRPKDILRGLRRPQRTQNSINSLSIRDPKSVGSMSLSAAIFPRPNRWFRIGALLGRKTIHPSFRSRSSKRNRGRIGFCCGWVVEDLGVAIP